MRSEYCFHNSVGSPELNCRQAFGVFRQCSAKLSAIFSIEKRGFLLVQRAPLTIFVRFPCERSVVSFFFRSCWEGFGNRRRRETTTRTTTMMKWSTEDHHHHHCHNGGALIFPMIRQRNLRGSTMTRARGLRPFKASKWGLALIEDWLVPVVGGMIFESQVQYISPRTHKETRGRAYASSIRHKWFKWLMIISPTFTIHPPNYTSNGNIQPDVKPTDFQSHLSPVSLTTRSEFVVPRGPSFRPSIVLV